jgi:hypothetical protein
VGRALTVLAVAGFVGAAAACVSLAGLDGAAPPPVEAGVDGAATDAAPDVVDPCAHAAPPPPPAVDDDPLGDVGPQIVAVGGLSLKGTLDGGAPIGFDLDGVCTCFPDPRTAHAGGPSCAPPDGGGAPPCDGDGGRDVMLGELLGAYPDIFKAPDPSKGSPSALLKITQYNGRANDQSVAIALVPSNGIFDVTDCAPDGGVDASAAPYPPTWRGCDLWAADPAFVLPGTLEPLTFFHAYVVDHVVVLPATSRGVTFVVGGAQFPLTKTIVTARLVALDAQLEPLRPQPEVGTRFRLEDGVVAGRVGATDALRAFASSQATHGGGPLCGFGAFFTAAKTAFLCPGADMVSDVAQEFTGAGCNAVSLASAFEARPARLGAARAASPTGCAAPNDPAFDALFDCNR